MGQKTSFILYFENIEGSQEDIRDEMYLNLPKILNKSKLIFEPIYQKYGFHKCILTLEYINEKDERSEYTEPMVISEKLFKYSKKAYIKIKNKGECICSEENKIRQNINNLNEKISGKEDSKIKDEEEKNIEEINLRIKKEEIEHELNQEELKNEQNDKETKLRSLLNEEKIKRIENELNEINTQNLLNSRIYNPKFVDTMKKIDLSKESSSYKDDLSNSPPPAFPTMNTKTNGFLIEINKEFERPIQIYEEKVIQPTIKEQINQTYRDFLNNLRYKDFQKIIFNFFFSNYV